VILIEPPRDDYEDFFSNIFSFSSRRAVVERAYQATRQSLLLRKDRLQPMLANYGLELDMDFLEDPDRDLWAGVGLPEVNGHVPGPPSAESREVLEELDSLLVRVEKLARSHGATV
jgi:hypothetical protein